MKAIRRYKVKPLKVDIELLPAQDLRIKAINEDWIPSKIVKIATEEAEKIINEKNVCIRCDGDLSALNIGLDANQRYVHLNDCG